MKENNKGKEILKLLQENYDITYINNANLFTSNILIIASFCDIMVQIKGE